MAVTGTGTQADPFIVHSYTEFISLSNHAAVADSSVYIQFFDDEHPNQTINCNSYGSEFKWGQFTGKADVTTFINLNGCTIKNLLIDENCAMFYAVGFNDTYPRWHAAKIKVSNGAILNIFASAASSKLIVGQVDFFNVSISINSAGITEKLISGVANDKRCNIDNTSIYLDHSKLYAHLIDYTNITDSDMEFYVTDMNSLFLFQYCDVIGCRIQGKLGGLFYRTGNYPSFHFDVIGYNYGSSSAEAKLVLTNCVIDIDISEATLNWTGAPIYMIGIYNDASLNTNVICKSHWVPNYGVPSDWNYMVHEGVESIRNGSHLNEEGFVCAIVVAGG